MTFFNSKSGVGKTSLTYNLAWMFSAMGKRLLVADLDPQADLTAAFLDDEQLIEIWEETPNEANTLFRCVKPLLESGEIREAEPKDIPPNIALIPGDLALFGFEDTLSGEWPKTLEEYRQSVLGRDELDLPPIPEDPYCLGLLKHYHSLASIAMEARKPLFALNPADGAVGAHAHAVRSAYAEYEKLARRILAAIVSVV